MKAGICKFCRCTDARACRIGCAWVDEAHTVCTTCSFFVQMTPAEAKTIVVAMGYDWELPYRFDSIVCAAAALDSLRRAGYDVVKTLPFPDPRDDGPERTTSTYRDAPEPPRSQASR